MSTGGKQKLGAISKMGEHTLRRLLIIGSSAVVMQASRRGAAKGSWLEGMLARNPRMLVSGSCVSTCPHFRAPGASVLDGCIISHNP